MPSAPVQLLMLFPWLLSLMPNPFCMAEGSLMYQLSEPRCSPSHVCRQEDWFHYYSCNSGLCDFHLQPWLYVVVAFIVLCFLLSLLATLINCICCQR